jgi:RNA polymerase sigma factor (sigma-70 family)
MQRAEMEREIEQLHPASYGWALSCCRRNREEAEEVLQNVYLRILEGKARFDGRSSLKTWLFAVIRRAAASQARGQTLHALLTAKWARRELDPVMERPDAAAENSQTSASLMDALRKLARRQREVLELVFYHDMTIEEAAAAMQVSIGSARVHYQRGKKHLLVHLNGSVAP